MLGVWGSQTMAHIGWKLQAMLARYTQPLDLVQARDTVAVLAQASKPSSIANVKKQYRDITKASANI